MFTTSAQTLQLGQCYLEVHGIKYVPEVRTELLQLHRRGNFVNKTSVYQHQIYNIGSSLSTVDTQFKPFLLHCKEKQVALCSGLDQALKVVLQIMV